MAVFKGLRVQIVRPQSVNGFVLERPCEEFLSSGLDLKTTGKTCHQYICLEPDVPFAIRITVEDSFAWADANGLCLQIDFDNCVRVSDTQVWISRDATQIRSALPLQCDMPATAPKAVVRSLIQLIKPSKKQSSGLMEEELSFKTIMLSDERGKASASIRRHGQICIGVSRCKMEKRPDQSRRLPIPTRSAYPALQKLREAGVCSRIEYTNVQQRPATDIDVKVLSCVHVGTYTFLYRVPDQFERIKAEEASTDESDNIPEPVTSPLFEPEEEMVSPGPFRRASSVESSDASTIIVKPPTLSATTTAGITPPLVSSPKAETTQLPVSPTALTIRDALQMQAAYEAKISIYAQSKRDLEDKYLAEKKRWDELITSLEKESQNQKAEHERRMQALQYEYNSLQAKIARQQQEFNAEKKVLEEKIHYNKRVSEIFDEGVQKRTKLTRGNA